MGEKHQKDDPFRADAAVVYRSLRDSGAGTGVDLRDRCFPVEGEMPESTRKALLKRSMRRVFDSIVWMRHQGVAFTCVPGESGSIFYLGAVEIDVAAVPRVVRTFEEVSERVVTAKVAQPLDHTSDSMDVWHGGG